MYDYKTNSWTELQIDAPNMKTHSAMAYNTKSNQVVLYGGYSIPYSRYGDPTTWILEQNSISTTTTAKSNTTNSSIPFNSSITIPTLVFIVFLKRNKRKI